MRRARQVTIKFLVPPWMHEHDLEQVQASIAEFIYQNDYANGGTKTRVRRLSKQELEDRWERDPEDFEDA